MVFSYFQSLFKRRILIFLRYYLGHTHLRYSIDFFVIKFSFRIQIQKREWLFEYGAHEIRRSKFRKNVKYRSKRFTTLRTPGKNTKIELALKPSASIHDKNIFILYNMYLCVWFFIIIIYFFLFGERPAVCVHDRRGRCAPP